MYAEERQQSIVMLAGQRGRVSVTELADAYGVTTETVRRDLSVLDRAGLIQRVHGGAVPAGALVPVEREVSERESSMSQEKDAIARAAVDLLPSAGGSVIFDAGTTTARVAALLPAARDLTVITNSVPIAGRLAALPTVALHLLGGRVRRVTHAAVGEEVLAALARLRVDVAFIGTNALSVTHGLSTPDPDEAAVKRAMISSARQVVVVVDSTKFGRENLIRFAETGEIDVVVTDRGVDADFADHLTSQDIKVVTA